MSTEHSLTKQQKESVFLLQIGTFLEYFDLMLYVHMAVVLNELFFPPTEPQMASILAAFAFCSTYVLRPFGAFIFGYIGDNYGRKPTVIITTTIMALCCLMMANLPTYAEIGIKAAIIVSVLRIMQGMSSMGEIMGARIYITETTKPPIQYLSVSFISIASTIGSMSALGIATLTTQSGFNWRLAFWFGVVIAVIGIVARTKLRETPEFANAKYKMKRAIELATDDGLKKPAELLKSTNLFVKEKVSIRSFCYFLGIYLGWPLCFYLIYVFFTPILKNNCGYSSQDVIFHNFLLSIIAIFRTVILALFSYKIYPIYISKFLIYVFATIILILPFFLGLEPSNYQIFTIQALIAIFGISGTPTDAIFIKHFPVFQRFTAVTFGYALSRAIMYIVISFGLVYLTKWLGYYGIWIIALPITFLWLKSISYYSFLEKEVDNYPQKGEWQVR